MRDRSFVLLDDRGVLRVSGPDRTSFLQGIVSNDVAKVSATQAIWAAFLTPQGKYLHDFFLAEEGEGSLLLDCEAARRADLLKRMKIFKLRAKVELADASESFRVAALFGPAALETLGLTARAGAATSFGGGIAFADPRLPALGARAILPRDSAGESLKEAGFEAAELADYDALRIGLGLPDGSRDMEVEKAILLENGFDELGGVDWDKGCYMGQELTARTKYRALIKKRLLPVRIDGPTPPPDTPILTNGKEVGRLRSSAKGQALALLRLEALNGDAPELVAGEAKLSPQRPDWLRSQ
jgi:folate-binding protein YgfZ